MKRDTIAALDTWKSDPARKPLILRGARQTGKTWLLKEFGRTRFSRTVYVNFEEMPDLKSLFLADYDTRRIITALQIHARSRFEPEDTLIIFDEIQEAAGGVTSLKYFRENAPEYHLVAAGSLLGVSIHPGRSFPVGQVEIMDLHPMTFAEFLDALGEEGLSAAIRNRDWKVLPAFHQKLLQYLKYYFITGGMPEVVRCFVETADWESVRRLQRQILLAYEGDFSKYAPAESVRRIRMVWDSIPAQLARENRKFVYGMLREGARAREYELAIGWLCDCGLVHRLDRVTKPSLPLSAYRDPSAFKLFMSDTGLLGAKAGLNVSALLSGDALFTEFKGAMAEQFVLQQLLSCPERGLFYWTNDRSTAEVDFLIQEKGMIIPVEVKSGENLRSKSLQLFCDKYNPVKAFRTAPVPWREEKGFTILPLYAIR